jgi:hypothetical protein
MASNGGEKPRSSKEHEDLESMKWAMEVYKGSSKSKDLVEDQEEEIEIDIDMEDAVKTSRVQGIAVFYSRKSNNMQFLFSDMISAWGIEKLVGIEKLGDYMFKIEFIREEDKRRVIEGGPWWHKGDAVVVAHYDGLLQPSEIRIQDRGLWVRVYDLSVAMMKLAIAQKLGE